MPTYAYACTACGHRFEAQQSFSDAALTECPECEGRLRKLFNSVGIVFKGSGFYRTDSRAGSSSNGAKDGAGSGSPAEKAGPAEKPATSEKSASSDKPASSGKPAASSSSSSGSKAPAA